MHSTAHYNTHTKPFRWFHPPRFSYHHSTVVLVHGLNRVDPIIAIVGQVTLTVSCLGNFRPFLKAIRYNDCCKHTRFCELVLLSQSNDFSFSDLVRCRTMSSEKPSQSMKGLDLLALANSMADRGADDQSLQLLLSSASEMLTMDIDGEKAKAKTKLAMSTYYPPNKDSYPSSSARPTLGSTPRSPSPSAKDPSAALLSASKSET